MSELQDYLQKTRSIHEAGGYSIQDVRPRVICQDGWSISVQAGRTMYSTPRTDEARRYSKVEVGYPDAPVPLAWREYAERGISLWSQLKYAVRSFLKYRSTLYWHSFLRELKGGPLTNTVYPYIPIELVEEAVQEHGGIDWSASLNERTD